MSVYPSVGRDWNHELAALAVRGVGGVLRQGFPIGSGTIRWPRLQVWKHPLAGTAEGALRLKLTFA